MRRHRRQFHCALGMLLAVAAAGRRSDADYRLLVVEPALGSQAIRPDQPLPPTCREAPALRIMACRGEREPCSFVVETDSTLNAVAVEVGELRGEGGVLEAAAVDLRVVVPVFKRITDFPGSLNWLLLHDPGLVVVRDEPEADALRPEASPVARAYTKTMHFARDPVDAPALVPADIAARRQFWITVHVPDTVAAGTYAADITIRPANAPTRTLALELTVPAFDLAEPAFEYSVYHPAWLEGSGLARDNPQRYVVLSDSQYFNELRNMVEHGCTNPTIYSGPGVGADGGLDFAVFERVLALREQVGMRGPDLYVLGAGRLNSSAKVDAEQYALNVRLTRQLVEWAKRRGYRDVYLMGADEATGEALFDQRSAWESIHAGGGRIFVAHYAGYTEGIGDLLDLPVMLHPMHSALDRHSLMPASTFLDFPAAIRQAVDLERLRDPEYADKVRRVHELGFRIFTYMDPLAGYTLPELHRRARGLGLWKCGLDGTMTWSYAHITDLPPARPGPMAVNLFNFVVRGKEAPLDTLSWEAYREGRDDARYLATLEAEMASARAAGRQAELVAGTVRWLGELALDADLDGWRREMARRIEVLRGPGAAMSPGGSR